MMLQALGQPRPIGDPTSFCVCVRARVFLHMMVRVGVCGSMDPAVAIGLLPNSQLHSYSSTVIPTYGIVSRARLTKQGMISLVTVC